MITFTLPCKIYTKKYLENCFGNPINMRNDSFIGKFFFQLVEHPSVEHDLKVKLDYETEAVITITQSLFLKKGYILSKTNTREFNRFVEGYFKDQVRTMLDTMVEYNGVYITRAIDSVYDKFGMDETVLPAEMIKKDYQRYKKRSKAA